MTKKIVCSKCKNVVSKNKLHKHKSRNRCEAYFLSKLRGNTNNTNMIPDLDIPDLDLKIAKDEKIVLNIKDEKEDYENFVDEQEREY